MINVNKFTLDNGLRVVHNYDGTTAMVALDILYGVGARNEVPEMTGLAHLFEHLMFGGSINIPDFDARIEQAGGKNNAWTSNDFTNFYDILPAQNVETAFWLESDRMLSLAFSDRALEVQKSVVIEEFKQQCLNQPYGDESHHLRRLVYERHPYSWPVIGKDPSHIERVTQDDVRRFFAANYAPDNAVLAISGNVGFDRVRELAEKWFGPIPRRDISHPALPVEPAQAAPRFAEVTGHVPATDIVIAYRMDGYGTEQYFAADLITDLLANGTSSRFYRRLLMGTDLFSSVDASITGSEDPGMLMLTARLCKEGEEAERAAIDAINAEVGRLKEGDAGEREITRAINRMESARMFEHLSYMAKAQSLAFAEYHGEDINAHIAPYRALTPERVACHCRLLFNPDSSSTLIYRPE